MSSRVLLAALLIASAATTASADAPALADFTAVVHVGRTIALDPAVAGRFELVAGDGHVLALERTTAARTLTRDTGARWTVVIQLPKTVDLRKRTDLVLDRAPAVARLASEDVLYLARALRGRVKLARDKAGAVTGTLAVTFVKPERDLVKQGAFTLRGTFQAVTQ